MLILFALMVAFGVECANSNRPIQPIQSWKTYGLTIFLNHYWCGSMNRYPISSASISAKREQVDRNGWHLFETKTAKCTKTALLRLFCLPLVKCFVDMARMLLPYYPLLCMLKEGGLLIDSHSLHPNPRCYKYKWRIYWRESPRGADDFLDTAPLPTKQAFELIDWLNSESEPHLITNIRRRRRDAAIYDLTSSRFSNEQWAIDYDNDTDPIHTTGHR